mmetsp:Transcript_6480/g.27274  ORF Transcript_6480/g.27274 Transcript_6480/m.27274 type:complete len:484 (+) Transcript_6480:216-1667(+)
MSHHTNRRRHAGSSGSRGGFGGGGPPGGYHRSGDRGPAGGNGHHHHHNPNGGPREHADLRLCKFFLIGGLEACQSGTACKYAHVLQRVADLEAGGRDAGNPGRIGAVKAVAAWDNAGSGVKLFTGSKDGAVRMWDALSWKLENSEQLEGEVHCLAIASNFLACGYEGDYCDGAARVGLCRVFDLAGGRVFSLRCPGSAVAAATTTPSPGGAAAPPTSPGTADADALPYAHAGRVYCVAIRSVSATRLDVYTGGHEGEIHGWTLAADAADFALTSRFDAATSGGHVAGVTCLALFAKSNYLVSGGLDRAVRVWSLADDAAATAAALSSAGGAPPRTAARLECVRTARDRGHADALTAVVELVLADEQPFFVTAGLDSCFKAWDAAGNLAFDKPGLPAPVMALATAGGGVSAAAPLLLLGLQDGTVEIRQPTTQFKLRATLNATVTQGHRGEVRALATGDQYFCSAGSDGRLMVWQWVAPLPPTA